MFTFFEDLYLVNYIKRFKQFIKTIYNKEMIYLVMFLENCDKNTFIYMSRKAISKRIDVPLIF